VAAFSWVSHTTVTRKLSGVFVRFRAPLLRRDSGHDVKSGVGISA
jgi:hypothetical protein